MNDLKDMANPAEYAAERDPDEEETYGILERDPLMRPFRGDIELRARNHERLLARVLGDRKSLSDCANGHLFFGFHRTDEGWVFREWAPNARAIRLFGDFNDWNRDDRPLTPIGDGNWEIRIPGPPPHGAKVRLLVETEHETFERIPSYCRYTAQNPQTHAFDGVIWLPEQPFPWRHDGCTPREEPLLIYECHVGMSGEKAGVTRYDEFEANMLPRVKDLGYNTIQLMAVMEHPYYGSFGYQVSNFFAASSRFGTPDDLKRLIDAAHGMGIAVLLDLVHSHAARNETEGLGRFDGTQWQFFHDGDKGNHPQWDSKLFNYAKPEVLHFLLSNLKFWLEEYRFDGFRFDGVTSMLYGDHGLGGVFDDYRKYFSMNTDTDAVAYLRLATELCRELRPDCILVAEDMSGMPGMCLPVSEGGIGFDYRLGMGLPDMWVRYLEKNRDEDWDTGMMWHELTQRRPGEKVVAYCESHDQALVGDKTIMFRLADQNMYWFMNKDSQKPEIDRAVALHKMIRLITCTCAGEAYLNFMGNEFGHPEWIDFPRPGNGDSYHYARRQWSLAEDDLLRYHFLRDFDKAMIALAKEDGLLAAPANLIRHDEGAKFIAYAKGRFRFFFNFHPVRDFETHVPAPPSETWELRLHTSRPEFGGYRPREQCFAFREGDGYRVCTDRRAAMVFEVRT